MDCMIESFLSDFEQERVFVNTHTRREAAYKNIHGLTT